MLAPHDAASRSAWAIRTFFLPLLLLDACGGNPLPAWKTSPSPNQTSRRVDHVEKFTNVLSWQRSPYSRIDDNFDPPVYLIVAEDNTACITPGDDWAIAQRGDYYPCPGRWRTPR